MNTKRTYEEIESELRAAQARLEEVEETLRAITNNEVDALVVDGSQGLQVFTLQNADQPYRILMETMAEGALTVATDGTILYCNRRFAEMLRAPLNRIIGLSLQEIMPSEDWQALHALLHASEPEGCRGEYRLVTLGGGEITTYVSARPLRLEDVESFCIVVTDLTEQRRLEQEVRQSQKLEALGTLVGGIAHDFNNVLASIMGFTEMVLEDLAPDSREYGRLGLALKGAYRGRDLVKQILAFSRQGEQDKKPLKLTQLIDEVLKLLRPAFPSTIEIVLKNPMNDCQTFADPVQMNQVLTNLCTNAAHAMREKGGILEIGISSVIVREGNPPPIPEMTSGEYVVLEVSDTGCGMEPETLERIFDPFFTTKKEGTGLGLSVSYGIVKDHSGYFAVESKPGKGSTFQVYLPRVRNTGTVRDKDAPLATGGNERILIVDDEDMLVELNQQRLARLGYNVVATTSSIDALHIFRQGPDSFDLVITDQTMPNLTGMDLATELLNVRASIPILICTGHSDKVSLERAREAGIKAVLIKPLDKREMAEVIRRVLDAEKTD
jgi:PAS domain S-box-containing protein